MFAGGWVSVRKRENDLPGSYGNRQIFWGFTAFLYISSLSPVDACVSLLDMIRLETMVDFLNSLRALVRRHENRHASTLAVVTNHLLKMYDAIDTFQAKRDVMDDAVLSAFCESFRRQLVVYFGGKTSGLGTSLLLHALFLS